jgi:hypothetical protein
MRMVSILSVIMVIKFNIMETIHPVVELLIYFGIGLAIAFVIIPLLMVVIAKNSKRS